MTRCRALLKRLHVPTADEVTALEARIDALHARLAAGKTAPRPAPTPLPGSHQSPGGLP